jgi:hypothetical protein
MSAGIIGGPSVYGYSTLPGLTVAAFGGGLLALGTYLLCAYLHVTEKAKITI